MKPRHYILIAVLIGVAIFDYFHMKQRKAKLVVTEQAAPVVVNGVPSAPAPAPAADAPVTDAWLAYEHAANLRDAPAADFTPTLTRFETAKAQVPAKPGSYDAQDLDTCRMWLLQYRKGGGMKDMSSRHIDTCAKQHRDVAN